MVADVTVTGGLNQPIVNLYNAGADRAYLLTQSLAAGLTASYGSGGVGTVTGGTITGGATPMLIAEGYGVSANLSSRSAIVVDNPDPYAFNLTKDNPSGNQTLIGGIGGFDLTAGGSGNKIISELGGDNTINLLASTGADTVYSGGNGFSTISAGSGNDSIVTSSGENYVYLGSGNSTVVVEGNDFIRLGAGATTINVANASDSPYDSTGSATVDGFTAGGAGTSLTFIGGAGASTILGGGFGSYYVVAGAGGGEFHGGKSGNNTLYGGSGATTLVGGGNNDTLYGSSGATTLVATNFAVQVLAAGTGDARLIGAQHGNTDYFDFLHIGSSAGHYQIDHYNSSDFISLTSSEYNYAINNYTISGGGSNATTTFSLGNDGGSGATIVMKSFNGGVGLGNIHFGP